MAYSLQTTTDLSNLGDAIRAKTGGSSNLTVAEMATAVASIPGGGGGGTRTEAGAKQVNFYDIDGMCLYSYTANEFLQLNALPALPTVPYDPDLVPYGWNWTYQEVVNQVTDTGHCNVGLLYDTKNSAIITDIELSEQTLYMATGTKLEWQAIIWSTGTNTVDWGDGTVETLSNNTAPKHTYANYGTYRIKATSTDTTGYLQGYYPSGSNYRDWVYKKVFFPYGKGYGSSYGAKGLLVTNTDFSSWRPQCDSLQCYIRTPAGRGGVNDTINIPDAKMVISSGSLEMGMIIGLKTPIEYQIPYGTTSLSRDQFGPYRLQNVSSTAICIRIPSTVTSLYTDTWIGDTAWQRCFMLYFYSTTPPTLNIPSSTSYQAFTTNSNTCKIFVPAAAVDTYKEAAGWSNYASVIQAMP